VEQRLFTEPQDITIKYKAEQFKKIENILGKHFDMVEFTFFLALIGYKNRQCIPLDSIDGDTNTPFLVLPTTRVAWNKMHTLDCLRY